MTIDAEEDGSSTTILRSNFHSNGEIRYRTNNPPQMLHANVSSATFLRPNFHYDGEIPYPTSDPSPMLQANASCNHLATFIRDSPPLKHAISRSDPHARPESHVATSLGSVWRDPKPVCMIPRAPTEYIGDQDLGTSDTIPSSSRSSGSTSTSSCNQTSAHVLQLDVCGRFLLDYVLHSTFAKAPKCLHLLNRLSLKGAYCLSDGGLDAIVASAPLLTPLNLSQCPLITSKGILALVDKLEANLIDVCHNMNVMIILPALKKLKVIVADPNGLDCRFFKKSIIGCLHSQNGGTWSGMATIAHYLSDSADGFSGFDATEKDQFDDEKTLMPGTSKMSQRSAFSSTFTLAQVKDVIETEMDLDNSSDRDGASTIFEEIESVSVEELMNKLAIIIDLGVGGKQGHICYCNVAARCMTGPAGPYGIGSQNRGGNVPPLLFTPPKGKNLIEGAFRSTGYI
ncbi:hypothetical protein M5K25_014795 [Dendrobium thyrsiflorum]|uniref:Uncharacterized protein n=1 Tax=Dendrobium thyrsiflorum TaxID=117978 RepID=A0ABD0UNR3_DENTH